jgi:EAL domain-containing protein (putative c-di-GMP-specific phosphodiesterase class I)
VEITSGKIVGCEALLRLIDPKEGSIPTETFISVAEKSGLIIEIGRWVIEEAIRQIEAWKGTPFEDIQVSINVSAVQFHDRQFIEYLTSLTADRHHHAKLDIELTESSLISDIESIITTLNQIKALGITLSLDDFGTGYSSLSNLKQIPFDTLKIDRSFVEDVTNTQNRSFVEMIINISKILGMETVAEGVETEEQLVQLQEMGCDLYQGFLCAKPLPLQSFEALFLTKSCSEKEL